VPGEATFPLPTLPAPDPLGERSLDALREFASVQLFLDRAIDARPDFALTRENAPAVARICRDLDGIPLALELAAARARSMSAEVISGRLTDRFVLLKSGDRTVLPRQQTLRATIDWSYDLLAPPERALLQRLSVFAGGFALDAAEAVGAGDGVLPNDVLDLLGHLVDKSLVAFDGQKERYRLLETVRQYALERLAEAGDEAPARDRHLGFYVALSEHAGSEILGPKQGAWHKRLDAERDNVLLAFSHARHAPGGGAAGLTLLHGLNMWITLSNFEFWRGVVLEALAHPGAQQESVMRSRALRPAVMIAYATGRYEEAFALAQANLRIARACGDLHAVGVALGNLGTMAITVGREADAREHFDEGLAVARQVGDSRLIADMHFCMGELLSQQGQLERAERCYLEALPGLGDDRVNAAGAFSNLTRNAIALRTEAKAVHYLREMASITARKYTGPIAVYFLSNCADLAALRKEWALALRLSGAADSIRKQHGLSGDYVDARFHAASIAPAREAMGASATAAIATGRAMDVDTALREAEAWLDTLPPDEQPP
jgi:predicted ATPase